MQRLTAVFLCLCLLLTGCGWLDGEYHSVTPHQQHSGSSDTKTETAENYLQLRTAMENMVFSGIENRVISVSDFQDEQLQRALEMAVRYVKSTNPIGAYAVEDISYEVGTIGSTTAVAVKITYRHERSEIQKIRKVDNMDQARSLIEAAIANCDANLVMLVDHYSPTDVQQLVDDYAQANPSAVMETPEVTEQLYPDSGQERVWTLRFTYQTSRDDLRIMQGQVERIFNSAALYVSQDAGDARKLSQLYAFLMERFTDYQIKTSITPAYSLLNHGVGDSSAFAEVYAEMCRRTGIECHVVVGTRNGEPWAWNIVLEDDYYYHVDLLACLMWGGYHTNVDSQMENYVWDYSSYPECVGKPTGIPGEIAPSTIPPTEAASEPTEENSQDQAVEEIPEDPSAESEVTVPPSDVPEE